MLGPAGLVAAHLEPGGVERLPHFRGDRAPDRAGVLAGLAQARDDAAGVLAVEGKELGGRVGAEARVALGVEIEHAECLERRAPVARDDLRCVRQERMAVVGIERAREAFGALAEARHPVKVVGGAGEHQFSSTQVSLVPPLWLELTTSDPSTSATRVRPPGTIVVSRPDNT